LKCLIGRRPSSRTATSSGASKPLLWKEEIAATVERDREVVG